MNKIKKCKAFSDTCSGEKNKQGRGMGSIQEEAEILMSQEPVRLL